MIIDNTNIFNTPTRQVNGRVELYKGSYPFTTSAIGNLMLINDVNPKDMRAAVTEQVVCMGKNLMNYYTDTLIVPSGSYVINDNKIVIETTHYYPSFRYAASENGWIKNGVTYTFSEDIVSYSETANNSVTMALVCIYEDDTYTEKNVVITSTGRVAATITTDILKPIKYFELRPVRKGNITTTLKATVKNLCLSIGTGDTYEVYKKPMLMEGGEIKIYSPNSTIFTPDGEETILGYSSTAKSQDFNADDALQEIVVERLGDSSKFFGFGTCQKATIKLVDKERAITIDKDNGLKPYFSSGGNYISAFPTFYTDEVKRDENTNGLTITAYDVLYKANELTFADLGIMPPYSLLDIATACANALGAAGVNFIYVDEEQVSGLELHFGRSVNVEGTETIRDILNAIAEATQTIYYIDKYNNLVFKRLGEAVELNVDKTNYFTLTSNKDIYLTELVSTNDLGDNVSMKTLNAFNIQGETQYIRNNPFWETYPDIVPLLTNAINIISGLYITEFELAWRGNFLLEYADRIAIQTKDDQWINTYLLNDTITYSGGFKQQTSWKYEADKGETAINPATLGEALKQTFAKVDKVNKEIQILASETDANSKEIAQLKLDTGNIVASVESTQKTVKETADSLADEVATINQKVSATMTSEEINIAIQKGIDNGATQVNTTTGFTFNADGLKVEKVGSEISTQITEDGMTVKKNNKEVLTANNKGVTAIDLKATTYLIIGENSRFEDYGGSRTGCFWIGG